MIQRDFTTNSIIHVIQHIYLNLIHNHRIRIKKVVTFADNMQITCEESTDVYLQTLILYSNIVIYRYMLIQLSCTSCWLVMNTDTGDCMLVLGTGCLSQTWMWGQGEFGGPFDPLSSHQPLLKSPAPALQG